MIKDQNSNKTSDAKLKSNKKYREKLSRIEILVKNDEKELIKDRALDLDKSVNRYIIDLIMNDLDKRD